MAGPCAGVKFKYLDLLHAVRQIGENVQPDPGKIVKFIDQLEQVLRTQAEWGAEDAYWLVFESEPPGAQYERPVPFWLKRREHKLKKIHRRRRAQQRSPRFRIHDDASLREKSRKRRELTGQRNRIRKAILSQFSPLLDDTSQWESQGSTASENLREKVRERDGFVCQICSSGPHHRLLPTYFYPPEDWIHDYSGSEWFGVANRKSVGGREVPSQEAAERIAARYRTNPPSAPFVTKMSLVCDHLIPRKLGGPHTNWNLWLLCSHCNARKRTYLHPRGLQILVRRLQADL